MDYGRGFESFARLGAAEHVRAVARSDVVASERGGSTLHCTSAGPRWNVGLVRWAALRQAEGGRAS